MFSVRSIGNSALLSVAADLDIFSQDEFAQALSEATDRADKGGGRVILSLAECAYCDSTALSAIVIARQRLHDRFVVVLPTTASCRRIFEIAGFAAMPFFVEELAMALGPDDAETDL